MTLLAKSPEEGGTTLFDHTRHVVEAVEPMAIAHGFDVETARTGAVLHDLGKAHPYFQRTIRGEVDQLERSQSHPHRHELSSIQFLPLVDEATWPELVDMIVGHHKSVYGDARQRGLLDLVERLDPDTAFDRHTEHWTEWSPLVWPIVRHFGIEPQSISLEKARRAFDFAVDHCENKPFGWSPWRGLLMSADHFASAAIEDTKEQANRFYRRPDLSFYSRESDLHPLSRVPVDDPRPHTIVVAPTGAGKTDYLLRRCTGRVFYTLPFQASINAMYLRIHNDLNTAPGSNGRARRANHLQTDIRRVHAASRIELRREKQGDQEEEQLLQRHPGAAVKIMTPHQLAPIIFGTSGHEAAALDVRGQDVILDEVHAYTDLARAMTIELVRALVTLRCRVHIGSATIPSALGKILINCLGGEDAVYQVSVPDDVLHDFDRHIVRKHDTEDSARECIKKAVDDGQRILFISNRVATSQRRYRWVRMTIPDAPVLLVHSRYRRCDRSELEQQISQYNEMNGPCIVCATQVVEVSLDISFDTMITDAAPIDSLVQRFGRVNRKRTRETIGRYKTVHVIAPPDSDRDILPYNANIVRRSYVCLPDGDLLQETRLQELIDEVYDDVQVPYIDAHITTGSSAPLRELWHRPKSVMLDALEIESAACVLESDLEAYIRPRNQLRQELEIPVPWRSIARYLNRWPRIEAGNYPLVVPDHLYNPDCEPIGLNLSEPEDMHASFSLRSL